MGVPPNLAFFFDVCCMTLEVLLSWVRDVLGEVSWVGMVFLLCQQWHYKALYVNNGIIWHYRPLPRPSPENPILVLTFSDSACHCFNTHFILSKVNETASGTPSCMLFCNIYQVYMSLHGTNRPISSDGEERGLMTRGN